MTSPCVCGAEPSSWTILGSQFVSLSARKPADCVRELALIGFRLVVPCLRVAPEMPHRLTTPQLRGVVFPFLKEVSTCGSGAVPNNGSEVLRETGPLFPD